MITNKIEFLEFKNEVQKIINKKDILSESSDFENGILVALEAISNILATRELYKKEDYMNRIAGVNFFF